MTRVENFDLTDLIGYDWRSFCCLLLRQLEVDIVNIKIKKAVAMYVLIKWVKENQVSVGLDNFVKDKKMLKDPKRIGLVEHGAVGVKPPKCGWKAFPAQILCVNESLGEIKKVERQWIDAHKMATPLKSKTTVDTEEDRISQSDEEDETPQHQTGDDSNGTPEHDSICTPKRPKRDYNNDIKELEERLKTKEKEIRRLRRLNFQMQEGLAGTITKAVKDAIQAAQSAPSHPVLTSNTHVATLNQTGDIMNKSVTDLMNPVALDHAQRCESYKKLTRTLMDSIFSLEEMTTCSVTGKKGVVGEKRKSLDLEKVQLVIDHVKKTYPGIGGTEIKVCMAQKLKDLRRRAER
ncbi:uncharacterized protein LOC125245729 [Megalobrama amblycephala]|uniref:uncharacterized protein LOC125245729 n=1 Tax=Megalobrama amblycephala TaxID=75352 RepID=UPI002013D873|nr:uncharacterized protein LOC125245729 [Megalobrama amblycephala]